MNTLRIDESFRSRLNELGTEVVFCDEAGRPLGYFVPVAQADASLYEWARREFTDDEIEKARRETGGATTAEVLQGLPNA